MILKLAFTAVLVTMVLTVTALASDSQVTSVDFAITQEIKHLEKDPNNLKALLRLAEAYTQRVEKFVDDRKKGADKEDLKANTQRLVELLNQFYQYIHDVISTQDRVLKLGSDNKEVLGACIDGKIRLLKFQAKKEEAPAPAAEQAAPAAPPASHSNAGEPTVGTAETGTNTQPSVVEPPTPLSKEEMQINEVVERLDIKFSKTTQDVVELLDKLVSLSPSDPAVHIKKGDMLANEHRYDDALESYQRAEAFAPKNKELLVKISGCYEGKTAYAEAEEYYARAMSIAGTTKSDLLKRCDLIERQYIGKNYKDHSGQKDVLYKEFDLVTAYLKAHPGDYEVTRRRIYAVSNLISVDSVEHLFAKHLDQKIASKVKIGIEDASRCIGKDKKDYDMYRIRAVYYKYINNYEKAISDLSKILSANPQDYTSYYGRYDMYRQLKKYDSAHADIDKAIQYTDKDTVPIYRADKAELFYEQRKLLQAKLEFGAVCVGESRYTEYPCLREKEIAKEIKRGAKWIEYAGTNKTTKFYDKTSLPTSRKKPFKVWIRDEQNESPKEGSLDYTLSSIKIDCRTDELGHVSDVEYDSNGNVLNNYSASSIKMEQVVPDSVGEALLKKLCK